jgi:hypothetical protein
MDRIGVKHFQIYNAKRLFHKNGWPFESPTIRLRSEIESPLTTICVSGPHRIWESPHEIYVIINFIFSVHHRKSTFQTSFVELIIGSQHIKLAAAARLFCSSPGPPTPRFPALQAMDIPFHYMPSVVPALTGADRHLSGKKEPLHF